MSSAIEDSRRRLIERLEERGTYRRWVLVTTLCGMFATSFPVTILTVSLGDIADDFDTTDTMLTWVISGPMLASAVALPMLGKLGDLRGQRKVFLLGFVAATIVAALTALSWDPLSLIGLRTASQVIGSATLPTAMALIVREFPDEERAKALGWWSLVAAGAPAVGLAIGGPMVEAVGWRSVFVAQAALSVLPVVAATVVLRSDEPEHAHARMDVRGAIALAVAAGGLLLGLSQSADWGWTHPAVVAGFVLAPIGAWAFVRIERSVSDPLLPLSMARDRNVSSSLISQALAGAAYMGGFVLTPLLVRGVLGWSLSSVAALMLLRPLFYSLSSPLGGRLGQRIGERAGALLGNVLLATSMGVLAAGAFGREVVLIGVGLVFQGVGNGIARPSLGAILVNNVADADVGIATAAQRMMRLVGNAFGIAVLTAVYAGAGTSAAFGRAFLVAVVLAAAGAIVGARCRDSRGAESGEAEAESPGRVRPDADGEQGTVHAADHDDARAAGSSSDDANQIRTSR
ncbi:MFS transporter [Ilumatobacter sp.]|uniref:MFS transporter n=1 Tax=Ilumatobacter sp. TaxID=1967498 RepID=UPI003B52BFB1